jgi:phage shock protein E
MGARHTARWVIFALVGAIALGGCSGDDGSDDDGSGDDAPAQVQGGESLDTDTFADLVAQDGVVVLDVRTPAELAAGHLDGAVNLDVQATGFATQVADLDPDATYAVYCRTGGRSQSAMSTMRDAGIDSVVDLAGGIEASTGAGGAVVTES